MQRTVDRWEVPRGRRRREWGVRVMGVGGQLWRATRIISHYSTLRSKTVKMIQILCCVFYNEN